MLSVNSRSSSKLGSGSNIITKMASTRMGIAVWDEDIPKLLILLTMLLI